VEEEEVYEEVVVVLVVLENLHNLLVLIQLSPLASGSALPVSVTSYPITVGGGGAGIAQASNCC
jgi:hypothetical protein